MTRRDFNASATLVFVAPAIHLLPSQRPSRAAAAMQSGGNLRSDRCHIR